MGVVVLSTYSCMHRKCGFFLVASCDRKAFALQMVMYLLLPSAGSAERSQIGWWHEGINLQLNACRGGPAVGRLYEEIC